MANTVSITCVYYETETSVTERTMPAGAVQSLSWTAGRTNITDQRRGVTGMLLGRTTLPYPPSVGGKIKLTVTDGSGTATVLGFVSDFRVVYGITAAMDTWELSFEGPLARAGRAAVTVSTTANASTLAMANSISTALSGTVTMYVYGATPPEVGGWASTTSAQTYTNAQATDLIATLMDTEQGHVVDSGTSSGGTWTPQIFVSGRNDANIPTGTAVTFADDGTGKSFYEVEFQSAAYNYGSKVLVSPAGLAQQSSGTGSFTQSFDTINATTTEAANIAGYIKTSLDLSAAVPYAIRFKQASASPVDLLLTQPSVVGQSARVKFRSSTYDTIIEGVRVSAAPDGWSAEYSLSSSLSNAWLRLDDSVFGKLDSGRLGL